jgi:flagellar biosynthesis/type III secretory pathway chaperone
MKLDDKSKKIDPKKVEYDGNSIRLIIPDEQALVNKLKEKQQEIEERNAAGYFPKPEQHDWLIARVKKLTEALETIRHENDIFAEHAVMDWDLVQETARKALEDE